MWYGRSIYWLIKFCMIGSSVPCRGWNFCFATRIKQILFLSILLSTSYNDRGVKLTLRLYTEKRFRMHGVLPAFPIHHHGVLLNVRKHCFTFHTYVIAWLKPWFFLFFFLILCLGKFLSWSPGEHYKGIQNREEEPDTPVQYAKRNLKVEGGIANWSFTSNWQSCHMEKYVLWRVDPLLGNELTNMFP
jgi:hypothetical protein